MKEIESLWGKLSLTYEQQSWSSRQQVYLGGSGKGDALFTHGWESGRSEELNDIVCSWSKYREPRRNLKCYKFQTRVTLEEIVWKGQDTKWKC